MGRLILVGALTFLGLSLTGAAQAEIWCVRDFGATLKTCVFPSARDCFLAVRVSGGICERDNREPEKTPKTKNRRNARASPNQ